MSWGGRRVAKLRALVLEVYSTRLHARRPYRPMPAPRRRRGPRPGIVAAVVVLVAPYVLLVAAAFYSLQGMP